MQNALARLIAVAALATAAAGVTLAACGADVTCDPECAPCVGEAC